MHGLPETLAVLCLFGWIPLSVYWKSKIRFEELRAHNRGGGRNDDAATLHGLQELRREVQGLRDTTTKFDMTFDAALDRLEARVERVETRTAAIGADQVPAAVGRR